MFKYLFCFVSTAFCFAQQNWNTTFENGNGNQSATYEECIAFYKKLDAAFETITFQEMGITDSGKPLHLILFSAAKNFDYTKQKSKILINCLDIKHLDLTLSGNT